MSVFNRLIYRINNYSLLCLLFSISLFEFLSPVFTGLFFITSLLNFKKKNRKIILLLPVLSFFIYFFSFSNSLEELLHYLEGRLSLLIFPTAFYFSKLRVSFHINNWLKFFILGLLSYCLAMICLSFYNFLSSNNPSLTLFFYGNFTHTFHPSYISVYLNFGVWVAYYLYKRQTINRSFLYFSQIIMSLGILLALSKIGVITIFLSLLAFIFINLFEKKFKEGFILVLVSGLIIVSFFQINRVNSRFTEMVRGLTDKESNTESTSIRRVIWGLLADGIKQKPLFGYGITNVNKEIKLLLEKQGIPESITKKNLNAHNQFLQDLAGVGFVGSGLLILILGIPFVLAFKKKNWLFIVFGFTFALLCTTESAIERQAGIIFFVLFYTLLFYQTLYFQPYKNLNS